MPPLPVYQDNGPLDCTGGVDTNSLKGKSVIVTGGGNGLGEAYVRAFASAGLVSHLHAGKDASP